MTQRVSVRTKSAGFTMVELIIVIAILGILAATALPRFFNASKDARAAAVDGIAGSLRSSVAVVQAAYFAKGGTGTSVDIGGTAVTVASGTGIPTANAAGIGAAIQLSDGITADYGSTPNTFRPSGGNATCQATYAATGEVTVDKDGC